MTCSSALLSLPALLTLDSVPTPKAFLRSASQSVLEELSFETARFSTPYVTYPEKETADKIDGKFATQESQVKATIQSDKS